MKTVLTVSNLSTWIKSANSWVRAVDDVNFKIKQGETLAIIGESGCGKSMTALSIMRLLPENAVYLSNSKIFLGEQNLLNISEKEMRDVRGRRIAMIFQEPMSCLNPVLTVGVQIEEVLKLHQKNLSKQQRHSEILKLLTAVKIPEPKQRIDCYPHELSGGMKQRVMIAIALAGKPELLIADEPTTALDVTTQAQILQLLKELISANNMAMLLITHDLGVTANMADRVAMMYAGHFVEEAGVKGFFNKPYHPYAKKFFKSQPSLEISGKKLAAIPGRVPILNKEFNKCRFLDRCYRADAKCHREIPPLQQIDSRTVRCHYIEDANSDKLLSAKGIEDIAENKIGTENLLKVDKLRVHYPIRQGLLRKVKGYVKAVTDVNFKIKAGETLALVGESGSGKSTVARSILALNEVNNGEVFYKNQDILKSSSKQMKKFREELQIIFQDPFSSIDPRIRILETIAEGVQEYRVINKKELNVIVDDLLLQVGLDPSYKWRYPHELSGGQRQRVCIARSLAVKPKIIICDEPTSALDVSVQAQVLNLLKTLQRKNNLSYLFISHDISVVGYMADWIAVMQQGEIVEYGPVKKVLQEPDHPYTQKLLSSIPELCLS